MSEWIGVTLKINGEIIQGFILPDGELHYIQETEALFAYLLKSSESQEKIIDLLRALAEICFDNGYFKAAYDYYNKILSLTDVPSERAECLFNMGGAMERAEDYTAAAESYLSAFELPQEPNDIFYWLHNNAAYCLNKTGRYQQAEEHCQSAILIDTERHNAYKNLGISLQNQGEYAEAVENFLHATELCPADTRALAHLQSLIAAHRELLEEFPGLLQRLHECQVAAPADGRSRII